MRGVEAVYMSLDIDGIDPSCTPGTGTPEHGGPTTRECLEFLRLLFAELPIRAMDIVEVSPPLDISDVTSLAALKVMYEVFGFVQEKQSSVNSSQLSVQPFTDHLTTDY
jgi:agmatinase